VSQYILRRVLCGIVTFFGITVIVYVMASFAPGSPMDAMLADPGMTAEEVARRAVQLGLDKPVYVQYFGWLGELLHGNLGFSYRTSQSVVTMIGQRLGPTLLLTFTSLLIAYLIAIPIGIYSSTHPYSTGDYISSTAILTATAFPGFFIGMIFIYLFAVKLPLFPMGGMYSSSSHKTFLSMIEHLAMPAMCLALQQLGNVMRQVRGSMREVLGEDYVRTARAKGLNEHVVVYRHAFRNALIPVATLFSTSLPFLIGGAVVTEQVFSWPGMGALMVTSILARDYPVIMGITVVVSIFVLIGNLLVDLAYGLLDPRIRYD
jgi:peptide/nickel transport system permease protein